MRLRFPTLVCLPIACAALIAVALGLGPFSIANAQQTDEARDELGKLSLSDFLLEPSFIFSEPRSGRFEIGRSFVEVQWIRDRLLSAAIKVGSRELIGVPARYGTTQADDIALVEAYAQADSLYGRFRLGLIPIPFGIEGGDAESRLIFPRSLFYQERIVGLRDYGLAYRISNAGFFSDWAVHNGEGGQDLDNEMWFTARWGYQSGPFFRAGASGSTGRTSPLSTNPNGTSSSLDAGLDVTQPAKIRIANVFFDWEFNPIRIAMDATAGETLQCASESKLRAFHLDFEVNPQAPFAWLARFDVLDPNTDQTGDRLEDYTVGMAWKSRYETSVLYLLGTKSIRQNVSENAHSVRLLWRMTPSASAGHAPL